MQQFFIKAWQKQAIWLWLFLPIAWLYRLVIWLNKKLYEHGLKPKYYPSVPVIVIGNITVGGSGKTPFIIALVQYLQQKGIKVGVISRGYGGDSSIMPTIVSPTSTPSQVGDEPCLIVQTTGVPMAVCPNRGQAIDLLLQQHDVQLILADDGLQHHALDRDKNWIVVDTMRGFSNKQLLPVGFLREPIARLNQEDTAVIYHVNEKTKQQFVNKPTMQLQQQHIEPLFFNKQSFIFLTPQTAKQVIAMTGIGYPQRFFESLAELGFDVIKMPKNDHHQFSLSDFDNLPNLPIVITSKDAVKLRILCQQHEIAERIWVLPVVAVLNDSVYQILDTQLSELGIHVKSTL